MKPWSEKVIKLLAPTIGGTVSTTVSTADEEFGRTPSQAASRSNRSMNTGDTGQSAQSSMNSGRTQRRRQLSLIRDTSTGINI